MEKHVFKKLFTAAWVAMLFTFCHLATAATNLSVTATPSNPTAPASVTLAVSGDSDGNPIMVTKVEYFNGTTSLGVSVQSPFTLTLNNLAAGTYQISVKVTTTDPANPVLQSAHLAVTVGTAPGAATAYFIHTDQLNTPRAITNGSGDLVWQWDSDPFGKDAVNEQPAGQPAFIFNQRFPGQQFDRESNLHYNYFRNYDPQTGRYSESDPIGLRGGTNTFNYVEGNPLMNIDANGLVKVSLFGPNDDPIFQQRVDEYKDKSDECFVYAHGYPSGVVDGRSGEAVHLNAAALAKVIRQAGCKPTMPVTLYSCRTGQGENSIGEKLTKFYPTVNAPTRQVWYNKAPEQTGPTWIFGKNSDKSMNQQDPGVMRPFQNK